MVNIKLKDKNLFYIGGIVRDELLGITKKTADIDVTVIGDAIKFCKNLGFGEILQINEPFGTVRMKIDDELIDFASTREEMYEKKGHLPIVIDIGCDLKQDVIRRDFTVNALAKSLYNQEIIDYTGGLEDLKNKKLRVLHDNSFIDDPTRIVRGLKFSVRFGFELEEHTRKLQDDYLKNVNRDMSYKRLKQELVDTFNLNLQEVYDKFFEQKIYKLLTDKEILKPVINVEQLILKYPVSFPWLVYLGIFDEIKLLDLTTKEKKIISDYNSLKSISNKNNDLEIFKIFKNSEKESILLFAITKNYDLAINFLENLEKIELEINGNDLIKLGVEPSEIFSKCLDYVLSEKLTNPKMNKSEELKLAKNFFQNNDLLN